jgi:hypothetical protein
MPAKKAALIIKLKGGAMQSADQIKGLFAAVGSFLARRQYARFSCGDCERNSQCGLPPHDDCVFRLMQLARDGDRPSPKHDYLYPAVWPVVGRRHEIGRY